MKRRTAYTRSSGTSARSSPKNSRDAKIFIYIIAHTIEQEVATKLDTYTRYEYARIIGARALQISLGAPALITPDTGEPIDIAIRELDADLIPITVKRPATD
ncbi:MAG: DNA-directed RNA polymerase subunit K [Euryarchaeota archaeon]|nr:DNA-directed RNA polymerase subunit K [Euryarchaeota archaeon]